MGRGHTTNFISLLEAMYAIEQQHDAWLLGLVKKATSVFAPDAGVGGLLYRLDENSFHIDSIAAVNVLPGWLDAGKQMHSDPELLPHIRWGYENILCAYQGPHANRLPGRDNSSAYFERWNIKGCMVVNGYDSSGIGCALYLFSKDPPPISSKQQEMFCRTAAHLSTTCRLQRRLEKSTPAHESEPNRAASSWRDRVAGRWTLAERVDSDDNRNVLAKANARGPRGPASLSQRERQVTSLAASGRTNKWIAFELGLAAPTVRVLIARASAKLNARSRAELIARFGALPGTPLPIPAAAAPS